MDVLEELSHKTKIPDFDLVGRYVAGIPVYRVRFRASILRTKHLPTIEEFVLRLVGDGVTNQDTIAHYLGLELPFVRNALSYLNLMNLVTITPGGDEQRTVEMKITPRGREALSQALSSVETEALEALADGLTGDCFPVEGTPLHSGAEMKKTCDCLIQVAAGSRPTLKLLNDKIDELQKILRDHDDAVRTVVDQQLHQTTDRQRNENRILEVVDVSDSYLQYKPANVLIFRNRDSGHVQLRVFEGHHPMPQHEERMTRMLRSGRADIVPKKLLFRQSDITDEDTAGDAVCEDFTSELEKAAKLSDAIAGMESRINSVEEQIAATTQEDIVAGGEMTAKSRRIKHLKDEVRELREQKSNIEAELGATRIIFDFEHRDLLKKALAGARHSVIIVSPWINRHAVDSEIIKLIRKCVKNNVLVAIGYGMQPRPQNPNQVFLDPDVEEDFKKIWALPHGALLHVEKIGKTHEKILICDDQFCVVTSNNFLSFNGDYKIKQETGVYLETKDHIKALKARAEQSFRKLPGTGTSQTTA